MMSITETGDNICELCVKASLISTGAAERDVPKVGVSQVGVSHVEQKTNDSSAVTVEERADRS